jgi:beta-galactosidase
VDVVDANGNVVPDASNTISFTVTGEGKLLGVDNGDLRDDDSFKLDSRKAFNGHAYAVIQAGSKPGDIKLLVQADGLKTASILIETQPANPTVMTFDDLK